MRLPTLLLVMSLPAALHAQLPVNNALPADEPAADAADEAEDEILVTGSRTPRGSAIGDIEPEVTLSARDIRAYGASTIGELLEELSPLTGSIQGRGEGQPIVLLGGRRISGMREIRDLPPEAVARVDILPEEVALKYGYRADQKVVNFVLRRRFEAVTAEIETSHATGGGRQSHEADVNFLRIAEGSRLSVDAEYARSNPLFETERDIDQADPNRTLLAGSDAVELNATYNRTILGNVSATLTGSLEGEDSRAGLGTSDDEAERLVRDRRTRTGSLEYALNGDLPGWRWTLNGGYVRDWTTTLTDRETDGRIGRNRARSVAETLQTEATASGDLFELPAGAVSATLKAGFNLRDIASRSTRDGDVIAIELSRDQGNGQINLDVPLLDESGVGSLTANLNGGLEQLSDFGTLTTLGYGFNWEPFEAVRLIGSVAHEEGAPTIQQLGNPVITTPNVRVLDLTRGETVDVALTEGGNAALLADKRRVIKLGLTVKPIKDTALTLLANLTDTRIDNPTASFPTATPEIEAAFPDRFSRDPEGRLVRVDSRPVNFARSHQRQLRWGFNWSETLEAPPPRGADGQPLTQEQIAARREAMREARRAGGERGGGGEGWRERRGGGQGGGRGGFGGGGFGGGRQGRVQVSLFHTWRIEDTILIRPGIPELDLLDGSATGGRGGRPRHEIELTAGYNRNGLGARLTGNWQSGTTVRADPLGGTRSDRDLRFGEFHTLNLRLFADLGQQRALVRAAPFFRGSRVTLAVDNLLDRRLQVRDASGGTPTGYQPDLLDPLGRSVRISFRKLFFQPGPGGRR